jgi:ssDNA-binding replication factor A large subunit
MLLNRDFLLIKMDNYVQLVQKIAGYSKLEASEIERRVEAKRAKLSGLVSKEGAAQIVAAELGINFDREKLKISQLVDGMKRANTIGKIINISPVKTFNKNGREGKVVNLVIADESSNAKVVLWDTNHISLVENKSLNQGDVVEISNGNVRTGEIHLSTFSDIKKSNEQMKEVVTQKVVSSKKLNEIKSGEAIKTRAIIVQTFEPRYFEICPECRKGVHDGECKVHGKVKGDKRALLNFVIDDGHETLRAVVFGDVMNKLGLTNDEIFDMEKFHAKKNDLLGMEKIFSGNVRTNQLYNTMEFNVENVEEVNVQELIKELEAKV